MRERERYEERERERDESEVEGGREGKRGEMEMRKGDEWHRTASFLASSDVGMMADSASSLSKPS